MAEQDDSTQGDLLAGLSPPTQQRATYPLLISKRIKRRIDGSERIQRERETNSQTLGYLGRPFLLCGLPFKRPPKEQLIYRRVNGDQVLDIIGHPEYGLPFGADIQVPIWVTTCAVRNKRQDGTIPRTVEFETAAEMLKAFDLPLDGRTYRRMQERFLRVFGSSIWFGRNIHHPERKTIWRVHYFDAIDLWFSHELHNPSLPGDDFKNNRVVLSEPFAQDIERYHPPIELSAVAEWSDSPGQLYFYLWLVWRCYVATEQTTIPLFGTKGVKEQCGATGYDEHRKFRQMVRRWLRGVQTAWPECPAALTEDGDYLVIEHGAAINARTPRRLR